MLKMLKERLKRMSNKKHDVLYDVEVINPIDLLDLQYIVDLYTETKFKASEGISTKNLDYLGSGSQGTVYGYKQYAIKRIHDDAYAPSRDVVVLKKISHLECIPTLYAVIDNKLLIMERIEGETIYEYCASPDYTNPLNLKVGDAYNQLKSALIQVMEHGFIPNDTHDENVMICFKTKKLMIVDVGFFRERVTKYPSLESMMRDDEYINGIEWIIYERLSPYLEKCDELSKCNI